jgi:hypothetical protein
LPSSRIVYHGAIFLVAGWILRGGALCGQLPALATIRT